jgi:type I restriction enzyme S subunit
LCHLKILLGSNTILSFCSISLRIGLSFFERIAGLGRINKIDFSGNFHIAQKPSNTKMILICPDDLVISGINVAKGAMGVYRGDKNIKATIHYSSYTFDEGKINVDYFKRFLKSAEFVKLLQEQVKGGIKTEIKPKHILPLEINLPSIKEQKIIVKKLKDIETEESDLKQEITQQQILLKKLRQQILQEAIEGKLTQDWRVKNPNTEPASELLKRIQAEKQQLIKDKKIKAQKPLSVITEDEKLFKLPKSWVWCQVNDIANIGTGATPLTSEPSYYGGEFNWMTSGDTGYDYVTHTKLTISKKAIQETNCKIYPTKTLVVAMYGQGKTRGQVTELKIDTATNQACVAIQIYIFSVEANQFLKTHFKKIYNEIRKLAQGGAQPNLNMGKIKANVVALPPLLEQKAIVAKVEKLLSICDKLQTQITANQTHAEQLMQAVLKEAFTQSEQPIKLTV